MHAEEIADLILVERGRRENIADAADLLFRCDGKTQGGHIFAVSEGIAELVGFRHRDGAELHDTMTHCFELECLLHEIFRFDKHDLIVHLPLSFFLCSLRFS